MRYPIPTTALIAAVHATKVYQEIKETLRDNPSLHCPPSLAAVFAAELEGDVWNFKTGEFEAEDA